MESKTIYFDNPGNENTEQAFRIARERAQQLGIKTILIASTTGRTAIKAIEFFKGMNLIIVRHSAGFKEPNTQEFSEEATKLAQKNNVPVITAAHAFGGLSRSMRQSETNQAAKTYIIGDIIASTLRLFGMGMKVAIEIAVMAADAGMIRTDEEVVSLAGVGRSGGSDTAIVLKGEPAHRFFDVIVKELLCKPRL